MPYVRSQFGSQAQRKYEPRPKGNINLGPKSSIQWICREWVGRLGFNEPKNKQGGSKWPENDDRLV